MGLLGIDVGTSGVKVVLLRPDGAVLASATEAYETNRPYPTYSEQDPEDWWRATCRATRRCLAHAGESASEVSGIGVSGQMVGLVTLDADGNVVRPCILWDDQRSAQEAAELTERTGLATVLCETSNCIFATFVAPKLMWLRRNEPDNYRRIQHVLMPKDYVVNRLTGHVGTDVSDASGTCLFNVRERRWSLTMIEATGIPSHWLPACTESDDVSGTVTPQAAADSGLMPGTPVVAGAGDQPAQALGVGIVKPGLCSLTIGTSGVIFAQTERHFAHPEGLLHSFCHCVRGQWYVMGVMLSAGGSFQWLREMLRPIANTSYEDLASLAASVPAGCEGLVFLPYLAGERCPHNDPQARGCWIGLSHRHTICHLSRAVMEGITFGLFDSVNMMRELGIDIKRIHASGGAVRSRLWLQMLADILGTEIAVTNAPEGAACGAAMLAGIGVGEYANAAEAADALVRVTQNVQPDPVLHSIYTDAYMAYRSLYSRVRPSFPDLVRIASASAALPVLAS